MKILRIVLVVVALVVGYFFAATSALRNYISFDIRSLGFNLQSGFLQNMGQFATVNPQVALFNNSWIPIYLNFLTVRIFSKGVLLGETQMPLNIPLMSKSTTLVQQGFNIYPSLQLIQSLGQNELLDGVISFRLLGMTITQNFQFRITDIR